MKPHRCRTFPHPKAAARVGHGISAPTAARARQEKGCPGSASSFRPSIRGSTSRRRSAASSLQGYPDIELIVMDGGSRDGTVAILRKYEPWFAHWVSAPDRGQSHAIVEGMRRSTGEVCAWIGCDDMYLSRRADARRPLLCRRPDLRLACGVGRAGLPGLRPARHHAQPGRFPIRAAVFLALRRTIALWSAHPPSGAGGCGMKRAACASISTTPWTMTSGFGSRNARRCTGSTIPCRWRAGKPAARHLTTATGHGPK